MMSSIAEKARTFARENKLIPELPYGKPIWRLQLLTAACEKNLGFDNIYLYKKPISRTVALFQRFIAD
ncbi:hypothetical protein [Noviherbaspirillum saxi]|uniref:hypothetical protein n=1 Tax=Noviherbaspirillum saxi TaxID=2320863 RepID=UPI0011C350E5|nr:hypothetical protein [Noviherbaspirillum saxi]